MNEQGKQTLPDVVVDKIAEHYNHARRKHPYFADMIVDFSGSDPKSISARSLRKARDILCDEINDGRVQAVMVANVEAAEVVHAFASGDTAHAVEECYDLIAVILRMVDVLEGRQKLGQPPRGKDSQ